MRRRSRRQHLLRFWGALPVLAPLAIAQGFRTRRRATRLPPVLTDTASGTVPGSSSRRASADASESGRPLRLLVVGESTAVGVGASTAEAALAPRLAEALQHDQRRSVHWQVVGENGIRAAGLARKLRRHRDRLAGDVAVVLLGANDTSGLSSLRRWRRDLAEVLSLLGEHCPRIYVAPVPPFHLFGLLPQPLRWMLGHRGLALCETRRELARPGSVIVMEGEFPRDPRYLASDGYHPSDLAYETWARQISEVIKNNSMESIVEVPSHP